MRIRFDERAERCDRPTDSYGRNIKRSTFPFGFYTILPLPILYGVWHIKGGSGGGRVLRISRAIVLQ